MSQEIRLISYLDNVTEEQKLAVETCPEFEKAKQAAVDDPREIKRCNYCRLRTRYSDHFRELEVAGHCPKL